ncbi:MAG TPA: pyridoxamine 5'-phosphate oxidase family protein [Acidimicrobiales bacterium]|nr:pyridoxamine 5'-phosphate oxidase family protein [Acidimicrobiales bacterium]
MSGDLELVRHLAAATHLAVLATTRTDGSVHASLVSAGVADHPITGVPAVAVVVGGSARKLGHLRRAGRGAAVFAQGYRWVAVEGPVRIIGPDDPCDEVPAAEVPALLRGIFAAAGGSHENWDEYDRVMAEERRAAVFVEAERISSSG